MLYRVAFRLTGNAEDAEDAVQDAFLLIWKQRDQLAGLTAERGRGYFVQTVRNTCLSNLRRNHGDKADEDRYDEWETVIPDSTPPPDAQLEAHDELEQVFTATETLPPKQAEVFRLFHLEEMETDEVARRTGESEAYVRLLLSRARKKIKEFIIPHSKK